MATYSCELIDRCEAIDAGRWRALTASHGIVFDQRFVAVAERTLGDVGSIFTAAVRDETQTIVALASVSIVGLDLGAMAGNVVRDWTERVRRVFPGVLRYRALFCGLPVSAGKNQLAIADGADVSAVLAALDVALERLARERKIRFVIFKEFTTAECDTLDALKPLGYHRGASPPQNVLRMPFANFAECLAAMKAPYRSKINRSLRKLSGDGVRVEMLVDGREIASRLTEQAYELYLAVVRKSPIKLETLPLSWFRDMATTFAESCRWIAIYERDTLLAFAFGVAEGDRYHSLFGGVDYACNHEFDAYFNLMHSELDLAWRGGAKTVYLGQTADDYKSRLGCEQEPLWFYIRPRRLPARLALKWFEASVLPAYPPVVAKHVWQVDVASKLSR